MTAIPFASAEAAPRLQVSGTLRAALSLVIAAALAIATVEVTTAVGTAPGRPDIVDFHPFYLAGRLVLEGRFADAYRVPVMGALERAFGGGRDILTPFVYPPLFGLVMAPLAVLPVGAAFTLFVGSTLTLYLAVLRRLAGRWFWLCLLTMSPVVLIDIRMGQNGFLTGGLAGLSALLALGGRGGLAGAVLGTLAFKPQMATMLPVWLLLRRNGRALGVAAATGIALTAASFLASGHDVLGAFLAGTGLVAEIMTAGSFPLHRMTSIYGCALSLGLPARLALILHGVVALGVVAASVKTMALLNRGGGTSGSQAAAGVALMATAFVSPYFFDYDLTILGVGLALVLPRLADAMPPRRLAGLLIAIAGTEVLGLLVTVAAGAFPEARLSLGGPALLACCLVLLCSLARTARAAQTAAVSVL